MESTAAGLDLEALREETFTLLPEWANPNTVILMGVRGSHAHGTYIPPEHEYGTDDVDVFVVTAQPVDWYLGLDAYGSHRKEGQHFETAGEHLDVVVYDVRKFVYLLEKGNPNVHNWLWSPDDCYMFRPDAVLPLFKHRQAFLSQRTLKCTAGYASAQLHKMKHFQRNGYMGRKRKELVSRHGYDVKNAAHCIRLLMAGIGIAQSADVQVRWKHHQAAMLKEIKQGKWTISRVKEEAESLFSLFNSCRKGSTLPDAPDRDLANAIIRDVITSHEIAS